MSALPEIFARIAANRVLPAAVIPSAAQAVPLAQALADGGLDVMEVTFRNAEAPEAVRLIRDALPQIGCGAGTLLSVSDLETAIASGAQFGLSPGFNPSVVRAAVAKGFPFIPGVQTAGEMEQALEMGCPWGKFFPAEAAGGVPFLKAVSAPYRHTALRIIPLGGINPQNMQAYLDLEIVPAVGGSWLANADLLNRECYDEIRDLAAACHSK